MGREFGADAAKTGFGIFIFLGVEVARNPPSRVVAGHRKLGEFLLDDEIIEFLFAREFIAEAQAVVEEAEAEVHPALSAILLKFHEQLVVIVAYALLLTPYRVPDLITASVLSTYDAECAVEHI